MNGLAALDSWLGDIWGFLDDTCPIFMIWRSASIAGRSWANYLLERVIWKRRPWAAIRQRTAFFFDGHLEVRLVRSHKGGHTRKWVRWIPCAQIAIILFPTDVFLFPLKLTLQRRIDQVTYFVNSIRIFLFIYLWYLYPVFLLEAPMHTWWSSLILITEQQSRGLL